LNIIGGAERRGRQGSREADATQLVRFRLSYSSFLLSEEGAVFSINVAHTHARARRGWEGGARAGYTLGPAIGARVGFAEFRQRHFSCANGVKKNAASWIVIPSHGAILGYGCGRVRGAVELM